MKNTHRISSIIASLLLVTFLCGCAAPGMASGLFDGMLLPAAENTPVEEGYVIPDAVAEFLGAYLTLGDPVVERENGKIRVTYAVSRRVIEETFADSPSLACITFDFEALELLLDYTGGETERYGFTSEYAQEQHAEEYKAHITKVSLDAEHYQFMVEYPEAAYARDASVPAEIQAHETIHLQDDVCSVCYGLNVCNYCVGGDCNYCFGMGDEYCTAGCIGGRCIACDDGKVLVGFDINDKPKYRNCSYCRYGSCRTCGGDGYVSCGYCGGDGDCNYCYGTGECNYCF